MTDNLGDERANRANTGRKRSPKWPSKNILQTSEPQQSGLVSRRTKARTGCKTCKIRRLKCDETRPACIRCTSTGRLCDGYGPRAISSLAFDIPGSDQERRGYHFFRLQTAATILGCQDATYWSDILLQLSYTQPAIKHALVALASIHEALEETEWCLNVKSTEKGTKLQTLSWRQYNSAIKAVLTETNARRMPAEVILILSLLFNQYENFQCNYGAAYLHLKSGLKLLGQWSESSAINPPHSTPAVTQSVVAMINDHITPMLRRLDVQASFLMHSDVHSPPHTTTAVTVPPAMPSEFSNLSQARQYFDNCASWMFHNLGQGPEFCNVTRIARIRELFSQWDSAFEALLARTAVKAGGDDDRASRLLRLYYNFAVIAFNTHFCVDEMIFDEYTLRFQAIVDLAQDLIQLHGPGPRAGDYATQLFSFDISLAAPLFYAAMRCREPDIRRQAVFVLRNAEKASWNCEHCALMAQYLIDVEERNLPRPPRTCADVPSKNRVRRINGEIDFEKGHIILSYVHFPHTATTPINVALIPLKDEYDLAVEEAKELPPVLPSGPSDESTPDSEESARSEQTCKKEVVDYSGATKTGGTSRRRTKAEIDVNLVRVKS